MLPEFSFLDVVDAEFPILVGLVDPVEEPPSLFLLREMQKKFDDPGPVAMEVPFEIDDRAIAIVPDRLIVRLRVGQTLAAKNFRVDASDQDFLVLGTIEDADPPPLR